MLSFKGTLRAVGLSNCVRSHLNEIRPHHFPILVNQIELHPYLQRKELRQACLQDGIALTAYRPLAKGAFEKDPLLTQIGEKYRKSASQVALRWLVQQEIGVIPKSINPSHLKKNLEIFDFILSPEEMALIATLDRGKRFCAPDYRPYFPD
jgi:diketogulonate reductase-like aldo/keto reductase